MKEKSIDFKQLMTKHAIISKIGQIENGDFIDYYCVKIGGVVFTNKKGEYKFLTKEEAEKARREIKQIIKQKIVELE